MDPGAGDRRVAPRGARGPSHRAFGGSARAMIPVATRVLAILWPSFLVAAVAEMLFFATFDPHELTLFGEPLELSRLGVYTVGFFFFWGACATASALTVLLERPR